MPNFKDPFAQLALKQWLGKQYGGWSQQTEDIYNNMLGSSETTNLLTDQTDLLNLLKTRATTGMEGMDKYRQTAQTSVNQAYNKANIGLKESLAGSGMLRSGVATTGQAGLEAGRANALGNVETNLMKENEAYKNDALSKLLGFSVNLDQLKLQQAGLDQNSLMALLGYGQTTDTSTDDNSAWGSIFGGLLGGVGKGLTTLL